MHDTSPLIKAMAERCRATILKWPGPLPDLPQPLRPNHLGWMCDRVIRHSADWAVARLHRWIGFIQCGLLANGMLDLNGAKAMFDEAKAEHGEPDDDLLDHLDPASSFEFDIGGEG